MKNDIEKYVTGSQRNEIDTYKKQMSEIFQSIPERYKNNDIVYFKKRYKTIPDKIVGQKYRSAKKYKNTTLFPTFELARKYYYLQYKIFPILSNIMDTILSDMVENTISQFADIKDIALGDKHKKLNER